VRFRDGIREAADFLAPGFTAIDAIVLYFQLKRIFPSWMSSVPLPKFLIALAKWRPTKAVYQQAEH
jgi:hypothetical protein